MSKQTDEILRQMTKTPVELTVGDATYKLAPLELLQIAELDEWAEQQPFIRLKKRFANFADLFTDEERRQQVEEADKLAADPFNRATEIGSLAGVLKALKLSLSIHQPDLSEENFNDVVRTYSIEQLTNLLNSFSGTQSEEDKKK